MRISDWSSDVCSSDLIQNPDDLCMFEYDIHIMLNKDHGDPLPFPKTVYPLYHLNTLFGPHARRGLVEQQQAGFKSKSQAYIQQFLFPVRKMSGHNIRIPHTDHFHQFTRSITPRSEKHTSELQSLMRISYAFFCLKKKTYN